jgi:hypothetical protein
MDLEGYEAKSAKSLSSQVQHAVNGFMHGSWAFWENPWEMNT